MKVNIMDSANGIDNLNARQRRVYSKQVDLKKEVELKMIQHMPGIDKDFIHRVLAFSLSGTDIVDLKNEKDESESDTSQTVTLNQTQAKF